ncbi:MAG: transglycosylase domain-containing protein [Eubacteriales bacterium]|nr:transglycosylase domain-containing protein [Eubacteriales bacterium]
MKNNKRKNAASANGPQPAERENNASGTSLDSYETVQASRTKSKNRWGKRHPKAKKVLLSILIAILAIIIIGFGYVIYCIRTAPSIDAKNIYSILTQSSEIYDEDGKLVDTVYVGENRTNLDYSDMPKNMINAIVALEDKTFWKHHGFNYIRIFGAIKESIVSGGQVSGTSTLTQQLARNVFLKEDMSKHSIKRKIREAYYTVQIEHALSKKQIIEAYLNTIYLGFNSNGIEAAAESYFSKDAKDMTLVECATLAALPKSPSTLAPVLILDNDNVKEDQKNILKRSSVGTYVLNESVVKRRNLCLKLMYESNYITKSQYTKAKNTPLKDYIKPNYSSSENDKSSYFTDYVVKQVIQDLQDKYNYSYQDAYDRVYKGGLKIYTTMDSTAQSVIEKEFENPSNFPSPTDISYDSSGNILTNSGSVAMYKYSNFIDSDGNFTFNDSEIVKNSDGTLTIKSGKRLKIYKTEVNGKADCSIEFPKMYVWENGYLYEIPGGYINVPSGMKKVNSDGDAVISASYVKSAAGKKMFQKTSDGQYYISSTGYTLNQKVIQPQAAMTIIENKTGALKAMIGGREQTGRLLYNRATSTRQPGSSIKPLAVYSAALEQSAEEAAAGKKHSFYNYGIDKQGTQGWGDWITAGSIVVDEETTINGKVWPKNSDNQYSGMQTVRSALQRSLNTCAVKIQLQVGSSYSAKMVQKFGITSLVTSGEVNDMNTAALALGGLSKGVSPLEMAHAYTVFANGGTRTKEIICYTKVKSSSGKTLLKTGKPEMVEVLNKDVGWIMRNMLQSVLDYGSYSNAKIPGVTAGGKTGTTDNKYDIWFDGFTPNYSASLWIGNDVNIRMTQMGAFANAFWGRIMRQIPAARKGSYSSKPSTVEYHNGEYYAAGTYSVASYTMPDEESDNTNDETTQDEENTDDKKDQNSSDSTSGQDSGNTGGNTGGSTSGDNTGGNGNSGNSGSNTSGGSSGNTTGGNTGGTTPQTGTGQ